MGDSLAIRLRAAVVETLGPKEGDDVEVKALGPHEVAVSMDRRRAAQ